MGVLGVAVDNPAVQSAGTLVRVKTAQQQVGWVEIDSQPTRVEAIKELEAMQEYRKRTGLQ